MNNNVDKQYFELLRHIINNGITKMDRTGTGTLSVFDYTMRFDMSEGFPLLTSKKMFTKGIIHELIWFLKGDTNIKYLLDNDVHIWDGDCYKNYQKNFNYDNYGYPGGNPLSKEQFLKNIRINAEYASKWGNLGKIYGKQWREWESNREDIRRPDEFIIFDQISNLITDLKNNPDSRRLMVSAWNPSDIDSCVLPPCHYGFQCYTQEMSLLDRKKVWCDSMNKNISYAEDLTDIKLDALGIPKRKLSLKWNQRSCDTLLGIPFNIASYGLLLHLLAREVNMVPHELIFSGGDVHIYLNHIEQAKEQLNRQIFKLPKLVLTNKIGDNLRGLNFEDFQITDYVSDKVLKAELSN